MEMEMKTNIECNLLKENKNLLQLLNTEISVKDESLPYKTANKDKTDELDNKNNNTPFLIVSESDGFKKSNSCKAVFNAFGELHSSDSEDCNNDDIIPSSLDRENITFTVQNWINHIPVQNKGEEKHEENDKCENEEFKFPPFEDNPGACAKLSRETSVQSNSSLDSILDSRRPDPVEIFLNLGFGGVPGVDMENCRIPRRFLVPSKCKGGDWNEFLRRELLQAQNFECSSLGFRGLSGPSYRRPSAIVANIMEKLRERASPQTHPRSRFSTVARRVLNEKSVLNKLTHEFQSVLSPDNRKFLQSQGKKSPEVPRRRIIFGQKSFAFAHDGEFVEVESPADQSVTSKEDQVTLKSQNTEETEDSALFTNSDVLLKLRRSSLQKQKKIEEDDPNLANIFYVGNDNQSQEPDSSFYSDKCSRKAGKIPRRFLSATNLKNLENDSLSEAIRCEVEREIRTLSENIKNINNQDLPSILKQVKELRSKIENPREVSSHI